MAEVVKQRALRPRRVVDYKSEGACETPMWLAGTKSHSEEGGIAKQDKKQIKTKARIVKDKENVGTSENDINVASDWAKEKSNDSVAILGNKKINEKRSVDKIESGHRHLKRITKRKTIDTAPVVPKTKDVPTTEKSRLTSSRVKTITMEEVSKLTDIDEAFDDAPEVQKPEPKPLKESCERKMLSKPKHATSTTKKSHVVSLPSKPAPEMKTAVEPVNTEMFLSMYEDYKVLKKKYAEMKNTKLDEAEVNTDAFYKNMQEHAKAHENLTENWKEEALRLAEVNKKACAQQTIDKLNELALDNAELKRKLAAAELKDIEMRRREENVKREIEEARQNVFRSEERASKAESQSHDVLQSAEHRINAANLRFAEYKKKVESAQGYASQCEVDLKSEISSLRAKVAVLEERANQETRLFQLLTGMQRRDYTSGASTTHQFMHKNTGFSFRLSVPDIHNECEVSYEPLKLGSAEGRIPEYFEDDGISFESQQLSAFFSKMLQPLQKCPPLS